MGSAVTVGLVDALVLLVVVVVAVAVEVGSISWLVVAVFLPSLSGP